MTDWRHRRPGSVTRVKICCIGSIDEARLEVKELGGTGRVHDWSVSRAIRDRSPVPVYLAGGLNPSNAAEAIRVVEPFALDVCSGLRTNGRLDAAKADAFMTQVRNTAHR